ncbi:CoA-binding protein [Leucobacter sp. UT-8R-CII-1-4]|uniref:CoA-binding protein n=1 Tax=Leucobacter sp. UT-8R-CII-1-4 TaxID=3040075 RepID=UPI0024A92F02|nr:CoA-binding protein [Leucobacter sp. UT-8R-CII-1-4]MDI6022211.1 CoA-binding protein [Leucobacter sp. UT-8R-CII-1-4]
MSEARTWQAPTAEARFDILRSSKSVAIVGASANPERASYAVANYLKENSAFDLYFVNPMADEILGQKAYASLSDLPVVPDIVDVFRKHEDLPEVAREAVAIGAKTLWLQLGSWNEEAAAIAESAGLNVVMDRCIKIEHTRFYGE